MPIDYTGFAFGKGTPRIVEKIVKARKAKSVELKVRKKVDARDKHQCFFPNCKKTARHKHHKVYRSHLGKWTTDNIVSGCDEHHRWVHDGLIELRGNPDKPPLKVVRTALGKQAKIRVPERVAA